MTSRIVFRFALSFALFSALVSAAAAAPATMRLDYYHTGNARQELFSMDRVVLEPLPWAGNPQHMTDDSDLGNYRFRVQDLATGKVLYSRGFGSIYSEWVTTDEAKSLTRTFSESVRFPAPTAPVHVVIEKREQGMFHPVWTHDIDPKDKFIDSARPPSPGPVIELQKMGDPAQKVDLLILGDGYTAAERGKFESDAHRLLDVLFTTSPFK